MEAIAGEVGSAADIELRDIQSGGRYHETFVRMLSGMMSGTRKDGPDATCEAAQKYGR